MLTTLQKFPAPAVGGKRDAAPSVWAALGDVAHYMEPFCFSCAVLLERPHPCNRPYKSESVNDIDGFTVNALRAIQLHPQDTAEAASWPISEADLCARHLFLLRWAAEHNLEHLMADPFWCDPLAAGWWLWGLGAWIGSGWCSGQGPWHVDPVSGRITRDKGTREPGVARQLPHLSDDGRGVNHAGTREPGVSTRDPVLAGTPPLAAYQALVADDYAATGGYHPMTMPELRRWFDYLSARLRHVRITNGPWQRVTTNGALKVLEIRRNKGVAGIFFDPPYADTERDPGLYRNDNAPGENIAADVRAWCLTHGDDPDLRIVLAGYAGEGHEELEAHGWTVQSWFKDGYLKGGLAHGNHQKHRERLWCSPHCLQPDESQQLLLSL